MTDDSEEIFRRAAEHYPLRTDSADFAAVLKKMESSSDSPEESPVPRKNKKRWFLLLLLLIPFVIIEFKNGGISGLFNNNKSSSPVVSSTIQSKERSSTVSSEQQTEQAEQNPTINDQSTGKDITSSAVAIDKTPSSAGNKNAANTIPVEQAVAKLKNNKSTEPGIGKNANSTKDGHGGKHTNNSTSKTGSLAYLPAGGQSAALPADRQVDNPKPGIKKSDNKKIVGITKNNNDAIYSAHRKIAYASIQKKKVGITNGELAEDENGNKKEKVVTSQQNVPSLDKPVAADDNGIAKKDIEVNNDPAKNVVTEKADSVETKPIADLSKSPAKENESLKSPERGDKKKKSKQKHFYAGLVGGPDFSTIKMQAVKKTGINYGFVIGYQINKRFSIETGLLRDKKFYSSKGQYFNTKKLWIPANATIEYVSGDCKMLDLPVNVYYHFSNKPKSNWFVSAGVSSYFMNRETYTFDVKRYGYIYPYTADYSSHDNQFAAVINFSAGYTHTLGRICDLRIEPYIKVPIGKVGTGDLPIQSAGLMIGITKKLF